MTNNDALATCGYQSQLESSAVCTLPKSHTGYHSFWGEPVGGMESIKADSTLANRLAKLSERLLDEGKAHDSEDVDFAEAALTPTTAPAGDVACDCPCNCGNTKYPKAYWCDDCNEQVRLNNPEHGYIKPLTPTAPAGLAALLASRERWKADQSWATRQLVAAINEYEAVTTAQAGDERYNRCTRIFGSCGIERQNHDRDAESGHPFEYYPQPPTAPAGLAADWEWVKEFCRKVSKQRGLIRPDTLLTELEHRESLNSEEAALSEPVASEPVKRPILDGSSLVTHICDDHYSGRVTRGEPCKASLCDWGKPVASEPVCECQCECAMPVARQYPKCAPCRDGHHFQGQVTGDDLMQLEIDDEETSDD